MHKARWKLSWGYTIIRHASKESVHARNFASSFFISSMQSCSGVFSFLIFLGWILPVFRSIIEPAAFSSPCSPIPSCFASKAFISGDLTRPPRASELWPLVPLDTDSSISFKTLYILAFGWFGAWGCGTPAWPTRGVVKHVERELGTRELVVVADHHNPKYVWIPPLINSAMNSLLSLDSP